MIYKDTDVINEVRKNREKLLVLHGGIEGLHKHMDEERLHLEKDGWVFVSLDAVLKKKRISPVQCV